MKEISFVVDLTFKNNNDQSEITLATTNSSLVFHTPTIFTLHHVTVSPPQHYAMVAGISHDKAFGM